MSWLKNAIVDVLATLVIIGMVLWGWQWAEVVVWVYTPLMLLVRIIALFAGSLMQVGSGEDLPPRWFLHLLYAVNVIVLAVGAAWLLAVGWLLIWGLSIWSERRG